MNVDRLKAQSRRMAKLQSQSAPSFHLKLPIVSQKEDSSETDEVDMDARDRNIRGELGRRHGTMLSFDDKLIVLREYSNLTIDSALPSFDSMCKLTATALQKGVHTVRSVIAEYNESGGDIYNMCAKPSCKRGTASPWYTYEHRRIKKEMVLSCHEFCMKQLGKGMTSTYAELHRHLEEEFDIKVSAETLRLRLIKHFDYIFGKIAYDKNSIRITYQTRRFLLLYSGQYHCNLDPNNALKCMLQIL